MPFNVRQNNLLLNSESFDLSKLKADGQTNTMPIRLEQILEDIAAENLHHPPSNEPKLRKEQDDAWGRVAKKNNLSAHEAKSIFKVLQKKFDQEKLKSISTWKLFQQMEEMYEKEKRRKLKSDTTAEDADEEALIEFLEVREEEEEDETDYMEKRSKRKSSSESLDIKEPTNHGHKTESKHHNSQTLTQAIANREPLPGLNQKQVNAAITSALQKKGISMRKAVSPAVKVTTPSTPQPGKVTSQSKTSQVDTTRSVMLPESIKRKLINMERREEGAPTKRPCTTPSSNPTPAIITQIPITSPNQPTHSNSTQQNVSLQNTTAELGDIEIKQEIVDEQEKPQSDKSNVTAPLNVISMNNADNHIIENSSINLNGFTTQTEELLMEGIRDIPFDSSTPPMTKPGDIVNFGNFDNHLPRTFFKNLCNSNRHEALGLYVANVMNRISSKAAAKLELQVLKAIIEAQTGELDRF